MFQGRNFIKIQDFSQKEIEYLIDFAIHLKKLKESRIPHEYLKGQNIALLFDKTSTRTRASFVVAANDLGAKVEFLGPSDIQLGKKETVKDSAVVFGSMFDGIEYRVSSQSDVEEMAEFAGVPVWNGMTDLWHPMQMLADYMTIKEEFGKLSGLKLTYVGDGRNNVARSLLITGALLGVNVSIASPEELFPSEDVVEEALELASVSGAIIEITTNASKAVTNANVIYTDVWVSMGEESQFEERIRLLKPYQVNRALIEKASDHVIFMHCLPAFHDNKTTISQMTLTQYGLAEMEATDEVFNGTWARQFPQAENRLHTAKAVMAATNGNLFIPTID
ncbi:ornithine carbamoyltransferase [Fundicoccus ignavus]|uniref:Ornithine carbamoyltransferase n=1 Tax=Fundicoccus ignavus TaxID=2664442 RepID=A0A844CGB4_9LACT|nr:ornithine carbamoyltransferase [Fundicoccus ignavus]MRJ48190.1 ornithine carbamoyltransferase [Fundicoccus ignavus]